MSDTDILGTIFNIELVNPDDGKVDKKIKLTNLPDWSYPYITMIPRIEMEWHMMGCPMSSHPFPCLDRQRSVGVEGKVKILSRDPSSQKMRGT